MKDPLMKTIAAKTAQQYVTKEISLNSQYLKRVGKKYSNNLLGHFIT